MEPRRILGEARSEPVIQRQHLVAFGLGPPQLDPLGQAFRLAFRQILPIAWIRVIFAADLAWVAGSVLVLALPATWTTAGIAGIVVVALIVADLAILEYLGLRRLGTAT